MAATQLQRVPLPPQGFLQDSPHPLHQGLERLLVGHAQDQRCELMSPRTRGHVTVPQSPTEATSELCKHRVAGVTAEQRVDFADTLEIEHGQTEWSAGLRGLLRERGDPNLELAAVGQGRELVLRRQRLHARMGASIAGQQQPQGPAYAEHQHRLQPPGRRAHGRDAAGPGTPGIRGAEQRSEGRRQPQARPVSRGGGADRGPGQGPQHERVEPVERAIRPGHARRPGPGQGYHQDEQRQPERPASRFARPTPKPQHALQRREQGAEAEHGLQNRRHRRSQGRPGQQGQTEGQRAERRCPPSRPGRAGVDLAQADDGTPGYQRHRDGDRLQVRGLGGERRQTGSWCAVVIRVSDVVAAGPWGWWRPQFRRRRTLPRFPAPARGAA